VSPQNNGYGDPIDPIVAISFLSLAFAVLFLAFVTNHQADFLAATWDRDKEHHGRILDLEQDVRALQAQNEALEQALKDLQTAVPAERPLE